MPVPARPARVLLVDDNPDDIDLLRLCLKSVGARCVTTAAYGGAEALRLLRDTPRADRAQLVLLDINMPGTGGREVLRALRADPRTAGIPVIVISSSDDPTEVEALYQLGASCYMLKPTGLSEYRTLATALDQFWFRAVLLP